MATPRDPADHRTFTPSPFLVLLVFPLICTGVIRHLHLKTFIPLLRLWVACNV